MTEEKDKSSYKAESIKVLEGLDGVRKSPSMYIGSTGKDGLHHLVFEVVDNSIDEALAGFCDEVEVIINKDGSVTVKDNGRGIPVDKHPIYKKPAIEIALTKLHAGGKFEKQAYQISGGLHGVGVSVVNALSIKLIAKVCRDGNIYQQEYKIGTPVYDLKIVGKCDKDKTGTEITFYPDKEIFSTLEFDFAVLKKRLQEIAFFNPVKIILRDEKTGKEETFHYTGGLREFIEHINKSKTALHKPIYFMKQEDSNSIEVCVQYIDGYNENIFGFVNTINTTEGGTHISGFKTALTRAINDYAEKKGMLKNDKISGDDTREGLTAIVNIKMREPQFEGQTKTKLGNSDMKGIVDSMVYIALTEFFEENPSIASKIGQKIIASAKAREAAKKARDLVRRKNAFGFGGLPGKLADCSSKKFEETELYIVEGDSAAGSSKMARDKEFQAILPLKGKILNVEKSNPIKALSSEEILNLITAIGTGVKENFDLTKLRYNKIIIMSIDGEEATFVEAPNGMISFVKIGEFIDNLINKKMNPSEYNVLCFDINKRKSQFKTIKAVIKHPIEEKLFEIKTSYGRNVKITSSHSIFVFEDGDIKLRKGSEIKEGDKIVAPMSLPLHNFNGPSKIDMLSLFVKNKDKIKEEIYIRGKSIEELLKSKVKEIYKGNNEFIDERVIITEEFGKILESKRKLKGLSQKIICKKLGIKQPCIYYDWEKRKSKPSRKNFEKYIEVLGIDKNKALSQVQIVKSKLDTIWETQYKNSGRNKVKDYIALSQINGEDLGYIGEDVKLCPTHYKCKGIPRFIFINNNFAKLIGFWIAEGSSSLRNGIRFAIGNNNERYAQEFREAIKDLFGIDAKMTPFSKNCAELKLVNRVASLFWRCLFGFLQYSSESKKIPDIIFNMSRELQLEFLRGYFLGDGTINKNGISFTTTSKDLANQLLYLLQSHKIIAGISERKPRVINPDDKIKQKNTAYNIYITRREYLIKIKRIWESHRNSFYLNKKIISNFPSINAKFKTVSDDLIALEVKGIKEAKASNGQVYDFSVDGDENFIAGLGGLCCHNTDADVDGSHIRTLLLTFFYRYMPELIENGNVFVAVSPLYRVRKRGDHYIHSDEELEEIKQKLGQNVDVQRFKGLGEMNPEQLWETTMNPKTRLLKKVIIEDAALADEVFSKLMGDDVEARRQFIAERAQEAQIDI